MAKNLCGKARSKDDPYEIWRAPNGWEWHVLKKWQANDDKPYGRWFCRVKGDFDEMGDVYVSEIKPFATLVWRDPELTAAMEAQANA